MPWKIVNLDFATRPHLHLKDPNQDIHMRSFLNEARVEIGLGAEHPEECPVRAVVTEDDVRVDATQFQARHVAILASILASLDVEPGERTAALAWMNAQLPAREGETLQGNVASFPPPAGWPYDLTDAALLESLSDKKDVPHTRLRALTREAERRGLRRPAPAVEVMHHRRPPR